MDRSVSAVTVQVIKLDGTEITVEIGWSVAGISVGIGV
jgi:hypothetical protein